MENLKTMLFCTGYVNSPAAVERYRKWINFYLEKREELGVDRIFIIDDGSNNFFIKELEKATHHKILYYRMRRLPEQEKQRTDEVREQLRNEGLADERYESEAMYSLPLEESMDKNKIVWLSFPDNLGRPTTLCIPGWWRSFSFSSIIALAYHFDKVIHIESDSYILTNKLFDFIKNKNEGYNVLWCPSMAPYGTPETCIQWIMKEFLYKIQIAWHMGKNYWYGSCIPLTHYVPERFLAFTNIWQQFLGDRIGDDAFDTNKIQTIKDYDYICNISDISLGGVNQRNITEKEEIIQLIFKSIMKGTSNE